MDPSTVTGHYEQAPEESAGPLATQELLRADVDPVNSEALLDQSAVRVMREMPAIMERLRTVGTTLISLLGNQLVAVHAQAVGEASPLVENVIARRYYYCFDLFDGIQYPMTYGTNVGEADLVEIIRVCPEDALALVPDVEKRRQKLRGLVAAHFGAFLDRDWRVNDLLWGRLDAAERIISSMLPWTSTVALRDRLIDDAQNEILRTFGAQKTLGEMATQQAVRDKPEADVTPEMIRDVVNVVLPPLAPPSREQHQRFMRVWNTVVPEHPNRVALMRTLARGTQIVGEMLDEISEDTNVPTPGRWITRLGRVLWGIIEISVPRSIGQLLGKYWSSLALLIGILLIVLGLVSDRSDVGGVGWMIVTFAIAVSVARSILHSFMAGGSLRRLRTLAIAAIAFVLIAGIVQSYTWVQAVVTWIDRILGRAS